MAEMTIDQYREILRQDILLRIKIANLELAQIDDDNFVHHDMLTRRMQALDQQLLDDFHLESLINENP